MWTAKIVKREGEYRVRFYFDGKPDSEMDYFTNDRSDADGTARDMLDRLNRSAGLSRA